MHVFNNIHSTRKKYFILGIILVFICFLFILLNLSHIKTYSFQNNISKKVVSNTTFTSTSTITSTTSATTTSTSTSTTSTSISTVTSPPTINNEILCNNISDNNHLNISHHPCEQIRCAVLLRHSVGRLGNRIFMFASAYGLARTHDCRLYVSHQILHELSDNFANISIQENMRLPEEQIVNMTGIVTKSTVCDFLPDLFRPNAFKYIELQGFWQSYLYFDAYREDIRNFFTGRLETLSTLSKYFFRITKNDCQTCSPPPNTSHSELRQTIRTRYNVTWIGVHIRLSDFQGLGYSSNERYIYQAMSYYKRRFHRQKIRFLIASDDKPACEKLFTVEQKHKETFILPHDFSQEIDLIALSFCHHSIVTGGTFGFWAAYLAGGEVIHDIKYAAACPRSDYYPPWFKLVGETKRI